ncbi:MAG: type III secretion system gatekeeper subunit SctW [Comamonas sp.]
MSRIDASNLSSFDGTGMQSPAGGGSQSAVGQFAGQQVRLDDVDSMLANAAEEISMHHAEKAESKHSSERKKEAHEPMEVMDAEAIMAYMDAAQGFEDAEQLVQLAKRMLSGQGDPAQHARQAFGEPTQQFMALQYALQQGEREGVAGDVLEALHDALLDLEMAHGPAIRADINTIGTAAQAGASRADVAQFQSTYRDVVLGESSLAATLKMALERFGDKDFAAGLQRLTQALGQDLSAARPSTAPARLQSLVQDLYHLEVTATVLDGCRALQAELATRHGVDDMSPVALMRGLVDVSAEKWVSAQRFTGLSQSCGAGEPQPQILFMTRVKALLREMPVQVFVDAEQRQTVFNAAQEALDKAIDLEEY